MVFPLQVIGFGFALLMLFFTFYNYKRKRFTLTDLAIWAGVWLFFLAAVSFSNALESLLQPLQVVRVFDLIIVVGLGMVLAVSFIMYGIVRENEQRVRELVRKLALEKGK